MSSNESVVLVRVFPPQNIRPVSDHFEVVSVIFPHTQLVPRRACNMSLTFITVNIA